MPTSPRLFNATNLIHKGVNILEVYYPDWERLSKYISPDKGAPWKYIPQDQGPLLMYVPQTGEHAHDYRTQNANNFLKNYI